MLKFIFILASIFGVGYLLARDTWMVTIQGFGYEITTSVLIFILAICLIFYLLHLLKKPVRWFYGCQTWWTKRQQSKKEAFLLSALQTVLDKDSGAVKQLLKDKDKFFDKKSDENCILEALFNPQPHAFEKLIHREKTELAGIRGLLAYAQENGDWNEVGRLLQKAAEKHENEPWIQEMLWKAQILQNDWREALTTLDKLKKMGLVAKDEYNKRKAALVFKLGRIKEAYGLDDNNPAIVIAYAKAEPQKAVSLIQKLWTKTPCWDAFLTYLQAIRDEKPAKQTKLVDRLIKSNPEHRLSLLALAQTAMSQELWVAAKERLNAYLNTYPMTSKVAHMMAEIERKGWNHEDAAKKWDEKALIAPNETGWGCSACGHKTEEWEIRCPHCNAFGTVQAR